MSTEFVDIMVDLETLGRRPGCSILSIGGVEFNPVTKTLGEEFYLVVNRASCSGFGLEEDLKTLEWWEKQSHEARRVLTQAEHPASSEVLPIALLKFREWLFQFGLENVRIWGNGADFDNAILAVAYGACYIEVPWKFWNNRCYRTLKSLLPEDRIKRSGTYHNALDDAKSQAQHAISLLNRLSAGV